MTIDHLAIWVDDLEKMKNFYIDYFNFSSSELYHNSNRGFSSYFLSFKEEATRIELMHLENIAEPTPKRGFSKGLAHFAITIGTKTQVNQLTERLRKDGYTIESETRTTGDGYYESAIADPEGNYVELLAE